MPESLHSTEAKAIANAQTEIGKALTDKWLQGEDIVHKIVGELGILVIDHNITSAPKLTDYLLSLPKESYTPVWLDIYDLLDAQNKEGNGQKVRRLVSIARLAGMDRAVDPRVKQMLIDYENKYPEPETVKQLSLKEKIEQSLLSETTGNSTSVAFSPDELARFMNEYKEPRGKFSFEDITATIENGRLKLAGNVITADKKKIDISDTSLLTVDERMIAALFKTPGWTTNFSVEGDHLVLNFSKPEPELAPPPAVPPPEPAIPALPDASQSKPAPEPRLPTELTTAPEQTAEVQKYSHQWEAIFGEAQKIGFGYSADVFQPNKHPELVIKDFRHRPTTDKFRSEKSADLFRQELTACLKTQGISQVPRLIGYFYTGNYPDNDKFGYLVKEFVNGENMYLRCYRSSFPLYPGETPSHSDDQQTAAAWLVSAVEGLEEFHKRGVVISDFKVSDYPWSKDKNSAMFIDLGNCLSVEEMSKEDAERAKTKDVENFLNIFFYLSKHSGAEMNDLSFRAEGTSPTWWRHQEGPDAALESAHQKGACSSLFYITIMYIETFVKKEKHHSAGEFADALKAYFHEVGLYDGPMPAPRVEKPADTPAPVPAPEPPPNPEDEVKEKEVDIGIGDFLQARDTYLTFLKENDKRAYDAFMEVCNDLLKTQAKAYSKDHPLATLYGDADLAIPLGVRQIESYLEKNPFEIMRINNRRVDHRMWKKERAFIRNPFEPKMWEVMKRVSRKITPQLVQNKLQEDPLAVLTIDPDWHSFMLGDDQLSNMRDIIIKAAGAITVDQVKTLLNQHPETILRFTYSHIVFLPEEVNDYLGEFAKKVRFKLRPEDTQIPPAQGEIHLDTEEGVSLNIGPSANV